MKKTTIFFMVMGLLIVQSAAGVRVIQIELDVYKNDSVEPVRTWLLDSEPSFYVKPGDYLLEFEDSSGSKVYSQSLAIDFILYSDPPIEVDKKSLNLKLEYKESMKRVNLYRGDKLLFSQELVLCDLDGVCDIGTETNLNCPEDCPLREKDGICTRALDGVCDPDCTEGADIDCSVSTTIQTTTTTEATTTMVASSTTTAKPTTTTTLPASSGGGLFDYLIYVVVLMVLAVAVFLVYRRMNAAKIEKQREEYLKWKEESEKPKT